jgi:hypothetical protein
LDLHRAGELHGWSTIRDMWNKIFHKQTFGYLLQCEWNERVRRLTERATPAPNRKWEIDAWGSDKASMKRLENLMISGLRCMSDLYTESDVSDHILEKIAEFTSEVGWWRVALAANREDLRREYRKYMYEVSFPAYDFFDRIHILQECFHTGFLATTGKGGVTPTATEHTCCHLMRIVSGSLTDYDLDILHKNFRLMISMVSSTYVQDMVLYRNQFIEQAIDERCDIDK